MFRPFKPVLAACIILFAGAMDLAWADDAPAQAEQSGGKSTQKPQTKISSSEIDAYVAALPPATREQISHSAFSAGQQKFLIVLSMALATSRECKSVDLDSVATDPNSEKAAAGTAVKTELLRIEAGGKIYNFGADQQKNTSIRLQSGDELNSAPGERHETWSLSACETVKPVTIYYREVQSAQ